MIRTSLLSLVALIASSYGLAAQIPSWPVTPVPLTTVGTHSGDPNHELVGILGAVRQANGQLVVAASDPLQVRLYDARGTFLTSVGRHGNGPGEYHGRLTLRTLPGDSILVFDDETTRWTVYQAGGRVVRSWISTPAERAQVKTVGYRRTLIHPDARVPVACLRPLIESLPIPRDSSYRELFPDGPDRAWLRDESSAQWSVRSWTGRMLGRVVLPQGFELLQIGDGFVVGRRRDGEGFERIEVLKVGMPPHALAAPCASQPAAALPLEADGLWRNLSINLRNLESAGEAYHADYGHYAGTLDSLTRASGFTLSSGIILRMHAAPDGVGWDAIAQTADSPRFCRILVGDVAPIWLYRVAFCGP